MPKTGNQIGGKNYPPHGKCNISLAWPPKGNFSLSSPARGPKEPSLTKTAKTALCFQTKDAPLKNLTLLVLQRDPKKLAQFGMNRKSFTVLNLQATNHKVGGCVQSVFPLVTTLRSHHN